MKKKDHIFLFIYIYIYKVQPLTVLSIFSTFCYLRFELRCECFSIGQCALRKEKLSEKFIMIGLLNERKLLTQDWTSDPCCSPAVLRNYWTRIAKKPRRKKKKQRWDAFADLNLGSGCTSVYARVCVCEGGLVTLPCCKRGKRAQSFRLAKDKIMLVNNCFFALKSNFVVFTPYRRHMSHAHQNILFMVWNVT